MANRFCTNCGAQLVEGTAFCTSCGAPAAAETPPLAPAPPVEVPPPVAAPAPVEGPAPVAEPPPVAAFAPAEGPFPTGGPAAAKPAGNRKTLIIIAIVAVLAVVITFFVQRSEREFQRKRRAGQTSLDTSGPPSRPVGAGSYGGFDSGGTVGSDGWTRNQIVGRWTETGDCRNPVQFRADGTTLSGRWTFAGGRLSMIESDWSTVVELVSIGTQEMVLANITTRRQMTWRRC